MINRMIGKLKKHKKELVIVAILLAISGIAHGLNMFHFPYYENDEGAYVAQAWSVLTQAKLAPYTYFYDHAPAGWLLIALWAKLTGGFFTFGLSANSGRVFMLVLHLFSTIFVYLITKKLTKSTLASIFATLIFSLSPLGINNQRRVLLDNIMTFWILFSFYLLVGTGRKLRHFLASAATFAIAVLTKESAVYCFPAFVYIAYLQAHKAHRSFAVVKWVAISLAIISLYVLFAILKGELFQSGTLLGGDNPHVSLVETFKWQMSRSGGNIFNPESDFRTNFVGWVKADTVFIVLGVIASVLNALLAVKIKAFRFISAITLSYWFFLMRGGSVIGFYITPMIPLLAISIAMNVSEISKLVAKIPSLGKVIKILPYFVIVIALVFFNKEKIEMYTLDQTKNQVLTVEWIKNNIPSNSIIIIDNYAFTDLRSQTSDGKYFYKDAHFYWKVDRDTEIKIDLLKSDWRNIDYLLVTPQLKYDIYHNDLDLVRSAYENSILLTEYNGTGWGVEVRKVIGNKVAADVVVQSGRESGALKYTVAQGDNLWTLAATKLGEPRDWTEIADLNDINAPYILHPGDKIRLRVY